MSLHSKVNEVFRTDGRAELGTAFLAAGSPNMRAVEVMIGELAISPVRVLLLGEPGAGKRAVARRIHEASARDDGEFRIVGCAKLMAQDLVEPSASGFFSARTVFLEEIGDLSSDCQCKLLEMLAKVEGNGKARPWARL